MTAPSSTSLDSCKMAEYEPAATVSGPAMASLFPWYWQA